MKNSTLILTFGPMTMFFIVILLALINTGLYLIASKYGFPMWYDAHRPKWMPERCEFCLFFWMGLVELIVCYNVYRVGTFDLSAVFMLFGFALAGAVISRFFLK